MTYQEEINARLDSKRPICPVCGLPVEPADEVEIEWEGESAIAHASCAPYDPDEEDPTDQSPDMSEDETEA